MAQRPITFKIQKPVVSKESEKDESGASIDYKNGDNYVGDIINGQRQGDGTYTFKNGDIYTGTFDKGQFDGNGTYTTDGGDIYEGTFLNSEAAGQGTGTFISIPNIQSYNGIWQNNCPNGRGRLNFDSGDYYDGQFENGRFHGKGAMYYTNGDAYDGTYLNGQPQGDGQFLFKETNTIQRRRFGEGGIDRANTSDLRANTYEIKKQKNVSVKEHKLVKGVKIGGSKAQTVNNSKFLNMVKGKKPKKGRKGEDSDDEDRDEDDAPRKKRGSKKAPVVTRKIAKTAKVKGRKQVKSRIVVKKAKRIVKKRKRTGVRQPTVWPTYEYSYPNAVRRGPVEPSKIFDEIDAETSGNKSGGIRRSKSISATILAAKNYFEQRQRVREARGLGGETRRKAPSRQITNELKEPTKAPSRQVSKELTEARAIPRQASKELQEARIPSRQVSKDLRNVKLPSRQVSKEFKN